VVLSPTGLLNPSLRFEDEFVRHKILDLVGDIALVGRPLLAKVRAHRAGHALHFSLSNQILRHPDYYEIVSAESTRRTRNQVASLLQVEHPHIPVFMGNSEQAAIFDL